MPGKPRPLLETWREQNSKRNGEPSQLLQQMRASMEGLQRFAQTAPARELREAMRRMQESGPAERLMGRMRPASLPQPDNALKKKRGRKPSLTPEEIERGICILRSQSRMSVNAACWELEKAGIRGSPSALYRLVIKPAYYGSG